VLFLSPPPFMARAEDVQHMRIENLADTSMGTMEQASLAETVERMEENCKKCSPLSTLTCIDGCSIWRLKNEFRDLYKKMQDPSFMTNLLNALKNKRRLQLLEIISRSRVSVSKLQQELKKLNNCHSQETIVEEYVGPFMEVGLVTQDRDKYLATILGCRLSELTTRFHEVVESLPPHSECYEEMVLTALLSEPKTRKDLERAIPSGTVTRVLNRLESAGLVRTTKENDYVFFFKTRRNPDKERFSATEKRVYANISEEGISARRLTEKTCISLRRTYKYLRRLKGKKIIFTREKPKTYALTDKGIQAGFMLQSIQDLIKEILVVAERVLNGKAAESVITATCESKYDKNVEIASSKMVRPVREN
jgi:DNA-binding PadR family transcriptional regulator